MAHIWADRVAESAITTGTGDFTLAGALTGFQAFSATMSTADTCYYSIYAVDGSGAPTGEWEAGLGTYSAANTLTRTTVQASSNADAAVNFAAGTKYVVLTPTAGLFSTLPTDPHVVLTQAEYDALGTPDPDTFYFISDAPTALAAEWAPNFTADGEVRIYASEAMTITQQATSGTGTVAYEKSTTAAPGTFASATSPITLEAGAWLKVSASSVTGLFAVALKRTA